MRVRVLRNHGRKVKQYVSLAEGVSGIISMHSVVGNEQTYSTATLKGGAAPKDPDLLSPLFEPALVTIGNNSLLLRGFESIDGASYVQEWHCEFV